MLCIGGANRDEVMRLAAAIELGASNRVSTTATVGGVARNVAQNLVAFGVGVQLLAAVGEDAEGAAVLAQTRAAGVDVSHCVRRTGLVTGRYVAVLAPDGQLAVGLADMEAAESLGPADIDEHAVLFESAGAVYADANLTAGTVEAIRRQCDWHNVALMVDLVSPGKARQLGHAAFQADLLAGNRHEASALVGERDRLDDLARALVANGARAAMVSGGAEGLAWCDGPACGVLPAPEARVVDVTGAGDALQSGVLASRLKGEGLEAACRAGLEAARRIVETAEHALSGPMLADKERS